MTKARKNRESEVRKKEYRIQPSSPLRRAQGYAGPRQTADNKSDKGQVTSGQRPVRLPAHSDLDPFFMEIGLDLFDGVRSVVGDGGDQGCVGHPFRENLVNVLHRSGSA